MRSFIYCFLGSYFLLLFSCSEKTHISGIETKQSQGIRIMTYNIHHCNPPSKEGVIDIKAIAEVIKASKAELVALQEVDVNTTRSGKGIHQARELAKLTGMYSYFTKTIDHQGGDYGIAVLSKFPILDSASYKLPMKEGSGGEQRGMAVVSVKVNADKKLVFASTHLDLKEENRSLQAKEIIRIFKKESQPVILAGDFNALPESKPMTSLHQAFTNTCGGKCGFTIPVINPTRTIDYILFRAAEPIEVLSHRVINETYASDHLPVLTELKLK